MVIATLGCFSEYPIHQKWRSHCCVSKLDFMISSWGIWLVAVNFGSLPQSPQCGRSSLVQVVISWCCSDLLMETLSASGKGSDLLPRMRLGMVEPFGAHKNGRKFPVTSFSCLKPCQVMHLVIKWTRSWSLSEACLTLNISQRTGEKE